MAGETSELDDITTGDTPEQPTAHLRYEAELQASLTKCSEIQTWEGSEDEIVGKFRETKVGDLVSEADVGLLHLNRGGSPTSGEAWAEPRVAAVSAPRRKGGVWTMQITVTQLRWLTIWSLDFADIDKPIRTWHAGQDDGPDLAELEKWELAGEKQDWANYDAYKTVDGTELDGDTLELAKMIREDGIESYTIHTPVVTCQVTYPTFPDGAGKLLDCWLADLPESIGSWPDMGGYTADAVRLQLDDLKSGFGGEGVDGKWLCTADPVHPNADGTFTRSTQFMLTSNINENLYAEGSATAGGFRGSQSGGSQTSQTEGSQTSQDGGTSP